MCIVPALAGADAGTAIGGPMSGFVFDTNQRALRPIVGVPGAALLGPAVLAGLDSAAPSPDGSAALVVQEGRLALLSNLRSAGPASAIDGGMAGVDRIAWSPNGTLAAVYASASGRAQVLRNLPGSPAPGEPFEIPGTVLALAVDDSGNVAAGVEGVGVYRAGSNAPTLVAAAVKPVALSFAKGDLYIADSERLEVWQVADFGGDSAAMLFAGDLGSPVGLQVSTDGTRLFVADAANRRVAIFDVPSRSLAGEVALDAAPVQLAPIGEKFIWLLNGPGDGDQPLFILDASAGPAAFFVPAGREE